MWSKPQKLVYLKSSLDKDVANILWDYDKEEISSLSGLMRILKNRNGGKSFAEKHRIELRNRRRRPDESTWIFDDQPLWRSPTSNAKPARVSPVTISWIPSTIQIWH